MAAVSDSLKSKKPLLDFGFSKHVMEFYAGRLSERAFFETAEADGQFSVSYLPTSPPVMAEYYSGMAYLLGLPLDLESAAPDTAKAKVFLRKCAGEKAIFDFETQFLARMELRRLRDG